MRGSAAPGMWERSLTASQREGPALLGICGMDIMMRVEKAQQWALRGIAKHTEKIDSVQLTRACCTSDRISAAH